MSHRILKQVSDRIAIMEMITYAVNTVLRKEDTDELNAWARVHNTIKTEVLDSKQNPALGEMRMHIAIFITEEDANAFAELVKK